MNLTEAWPTEYAYPVFDMKNNNSSVHYESLVGVVSAASDDLTIASIVSMSTVITSSTSASASAITSSASPALAIGSTPLDSIGEPFVSVSVSASVAACCMVYGSLEIVNVDVTNKFCRHRKAWMNTPQLVVITKKDHIQDLQLRSSLQKVVIQDLDVNKCWDDINEIKQCETL